MRKVLLLTVMCIALLGSAMAQHVVTGVVTDNEKLGIPGTTIAEKGTANGTISDSKGNYSMKVSSEDATLVFSFIGMTTQEISVKGKTTINVVLEPSVQSVEEVVVTALGITKSERSLGFAQSTISSEKLVQKGTPNLATALYGKAPGLRISATPGGATSGVAVQIRGVNSINFKSTPLVIMDGVPVRDGEFNNGNYWGDQRIRSNGLIDFNPEDIESITVLKGSSAAALYGSEAVNGVLLITTKSGKGKGVSVDFSSSYSFDEVAYLPKWQKKYGPGLPTGYAKLAWGSGIDDYGFRHATVDGTDLRHSIQTNLSFGPAFDDKPILTWTGDVVPYSYQEGGFANLFQTANNTNTNIALSSNSEKMQSRFSYTFQHTEGLSLGAANDKHNFNINSTYHVAKKVTANIIVNYINWHIHNRPYMIDRLINNFGGMFPAFDNGNWYKDHYKTSLGYRYVTGTGQSLTPEENIRYGDFRGDIGDFMWRVKENNSDEYQHRLNAVARVSWEIATGLKLQVRASTDYTSVRTIGKNTTEVPLAYGYSGSFSLSNQVQSIYYGDALLTYFKKLNDNLNVTAMAGYNSRTEESFMTSASTNGGLVAENKFDFSASRNTVNWGGSQSYFITDAFFGVLSASYKNYLFGEVTVRQDRTSTMNPDNNSFVYPSVNSGFVFSDAFTMPSFISYGKVRASWGIVGNYPAQYVANPAYNQGNLGDQGAGSVLTTQIRVSPFGNSNIKPEMKNEYEFGLETKMFKDRLNLDLTYYNAKINDQILNLSLPQSMGAESILTNIGSLQNKGIEIALRGTPVSSFDFSWEAGINFFKNTNKVLKLTTGSNELLHANHDGDAAKRVSTVGDPMGDWYAHPIKTDAQGRKIISGDGTYVLDGDKWEKYGNAMPKGSGGIFNTVRYKNFTLDMMADFTYGGSVMPTGLYWLTGRGLTEDALETPEGAVKTNLTYYVDENWVGHETSGSVGPNGEIVMHDGIVLDGVLADGSTNTNVISPAIYYWYSYNWGGPQYGSSLYYKYINKNNYLKMREISIAYTVPEHIASKIGTKNLQLSVFGRNLFYFYRSIKNMDSEQLSTGSNWGSNVNNAGTNPSSRTYGVMLRANF